MFIPLIIHTPKSLRLIVVRVHFPHIFTGILLSLRLRIALVELNAHRVDTVPLVGGRRVALALEHMSQVASAVGAHDLRPLHSKSAVGVSGHSAGNGIEESGPATARLELMLCGVNRCVAAGAAIGAGARGVLVVLARERRFGAFVTENAELLCW
jgi:hypothetical protein